MSYYEHGPDGRIVMLCQVCGTSCHADGPKQGYFVDRKATPKGGLPVYKKGTCPMCVCHDCIQLADDPVRAGLAPGIMGQTFSSPFNIEQAISGLQGQLGLIQEPERRRALPGSVACGCGAPARSRCISCDEAHCLGCQKVHECRGKPAK